MLRSKASARSTAWEGNLGDPAMHLPTVLQYPSLLAEAAALPSMADNKILDYTDLSTQLIRFAQVGFAPPTYYS